MLSNQEMLVTLCELLIKCLQEDQIQKNLELKSTSINNILRSLYESQNLYRIAKFIYQTYISLLIFLYFIQKKKKKKKNRK